MCVLDDFFLFLIYILQNFKTILGLNFVGNVLLEFLGLSTTVIQKERLVFMECNSNFYS